MTLDVQTVINLVAIVCAVWIAIRVIRETFGP